MAPPNKLLILWDDGSESYNGST